MSGVFQNIEPRPPSPPGECVVYPQLLVRGEDTLAGWRGGWGVTILEDARHSSVLDICKKTIKTTAKRRGFRSACSLDAVGTG
jgi:hypothetical protein